MIMLQEMPGEAFPLLTSQIFVMVRVKENLLPSSSGGIPRGVPPVASVGKTKLGETSTGARSKSTNYKNKPQYQ